MKYYSVDLKTFNDLYTKEYNWLYKNNDDVIGYEDACRAFDVIINRNKSIVEFLTRFNEFREDIISSDREAAAFVFALEDMEKLAI